MFFASQAYLLFFLIVFSVYWALPSHRGRLAWLLAASIFFYAYFSEMLALLVFSTTLADYLFARAMDSTSKEVRRKWILRCSLLMNLSILAFFKYRNFFIEPICTALEGLGVKPNLPILHVGIPFGISFYTFEAISYAVDVYKRKIRAERDPLKFMLFILFFPHLVAGPIVRAKDFLTQARRPKRFNWIRMQIGVQYFLIGLFKKLAIADCMAIYSDPVFFPGRDVSALSTTAVWLGVLAFAIQIYCDFSGYTDMALGSAHLLGYKLTRNFMMPYLAPNITEFWHRWHISLSTWLRDYLFIPLGGSRGGRLLTYRNLLITMTLGGLWHGANWSFVIWGVVHGLLLIGHKIFKTWCEHRSRLNSLLASQLGTVTRVLMTFFCVMICWVFFQPSLERSIAILSKMFEIQPGDGLTMPNRRLWISIAVLLTGQIILLQGLWKRYSHRIPAPLMGVGYALLLSLSLLLNPDSGKNFIYFQF
ncbi:MBOAT family protein [Telmatocola sphagniphila]|uniref:MBOAT family protein n=1 Tax=Telmatocola sphagniphila TaxID=1123043 RepID=A0A8E6BAW9_9BACT|nr:MBOAT family O-acyltransferase [Telmatocola sphagniphila]QVL33605.1 MBOAT family protein [Telmatocola sphagniphila]